MLKMFLSRVFCASTNKYCPNRKDTWKQGIQRYLYFKSNEIFKSTPQEQKLECDICHGQAAIMEKNIATPSSIFAWKTPWTGQRSLVCCSPWGHKESDMTERLHKSNEIFKNTPQEQKLECDIFHGQAAIMENMGTPSSIFAWKTPWTGWRSLVCCSPWGHKESDTTERLHYKQ